MVDTNTSIANAKQAGRDTTRRGVERRMDEEKQYDERVINIDRVARVVKGGRRFRFRALVVVGDHKGKVAVGIAKGADVTGAVSKAVEDAKKHFINVDIIDGTIAHEVQTKVGGAKIMIKPASAGTGLIAGGVIRSVLEVAGVHNILSKSLGSSNKVNLAYATIAALEAVEPRAKWLNDPAVKDSKTKPAKTKPEAKK